MTDTASNVPPNPTPEQLAKIKMFTLEVIMPLDAVLAIGWGAITNKGKIKPAQLEKSKRAIAAALESGNDAIKAYIGFVNDYQTHAENNNTGDWNIPALPPIKPIPLHQDTLKQVLGLIADEFGVLQEKMQGAKNNQGQVVGGEFADALGQAQIAMTQIIEVVSEYYPDLLSKLLADFEKAMQDMKPS